MKKITNAQIIYALLKHHNIRHVLINPGTTNIQLVQLVQGDPFFTCYSVVDERSAMYFAVGLYLHLGVPIATTCTSAQATRNYIPGLTEAFYKHVPILAITASKLPIYTYQEYMQQPDQTSLPNDAVKQSFALPYIATEKDELMCERMVNEAILELTHKTPGPIQINMPVDDEGIRAVINTELPKVKVIHRYMESENWDVSLNGRKIMIVIGEHRPFTEYQISMIEKFTASHNAFVYTNHLSNYHGKHSIFGNLAMTTLSNDDFLKNYKPDVLITIGGQTGDYPLCWRLSAGSKFEFEHWRVCENGNIADTYFKLTKVFECNIETFFDRLSSNSESTHEYFELWNTYASTRSISADLPFSSAWVAQQLHKDIPNDSYLNFAILNSLRSWNHFPVDESIVCYANVAAFGIDGCMSMFLGQSIATSKLCFLIIGDLAFFYDMNSLGNRHIRANVRILLVNNGGGVEFKLGDDDLMHKVDIDSYIAAFGHFKSGAKSWSEANGFKYLAATTKEEFIRQKEEFVGHGSQPIVFEVFTNWQDDAKGLKEMIFSNRKYGAIKDGIKSIVGKKGVKVLKKVIK